MRGSCGRGFYVKVLPWNNTCIFTLPRVWVKFAVPRKRVHWGYRPCSGFWRGKMTRKWVKMTHWSHIVNEAKVILGRYIKFKLEKESILGQFYPYLFWGSVIASHEGDGRRFCKRWRRDNIQHDAAAIMSISFTECVPCHLHFASCSTHAPPPSPGRGGGGTSILTMSGTCRWTGYDFPVITIDTGYLNRPNWLLAGYSVYHRVASQPGSQPKMFMSGPRSRHQRRDAMVRTCGTQQIFMNVWWYTAE